jgi:hypothetical protein
MQKRDEQDLSVLYSESIGADALDAAGHEPAQRSM